MQARLKSIVRAATTGLLCCSLLLAGIAVQAQDDPPGRVGRIAALQGEAWVFDAEQGEWSAALLNRPFTGGDRLATAAAASAEVRIGSTTLYLGSSSELEALRLDDQRLQFRLQRGSLALRVRSREVAAELEVQHPEGRFMPLRAGLYRIDRQDEASDATVWRGDLLVEGNGVSWTLYAGQRARFWLEGPLGDTRSQWLAPLQDAFALAVQRDDQADVRSAAALFVPPEMTGVEDLDRHGRWQQHPDYGPVWSPSVVVPGWAPYRHGQWVWLRPWGWSWVDDAPWGFAPFHYGRWLWWGGRWSWAPGPVVARPVFAPALVAWAGGPHFSAGVGNRPRPAVGWVPLAPREHYRPAYRASPGHLQRLNPYAPPVQGLPPGYGNRAVPGAVTVLPSATLAARQPVAAAALRADELALQPPWRAEQFQHPAPGRPPPGAREHNAPRAAVAVGAAAPAPAQPTTPPSARPPNAAPWPGGLTAPSPSGGHAPFRGTVGMPSPNAATPAQDRTVTPGVPSVPIAPGVPIAPIAPAAAVVPRAATVPGPSLALPPPAAAVLPPMAAQAPAPGTPMRAVPPAPQPALTQTQTQTQVPQQRPPQNPPQQSQPQPQPRPSQPQPLQPPLPSPAPSPQAQPQPPTSPQPFRPSPAVPAAATPAAATVAAPGAAVAPRPAAPARVEAVEPRPGNDADERRRTPDSRQKARER